MLIRLCVVILLLSTARTVDTGLWDFVFSDVLSLTLNDLTTWRLQQSVTSPGGWPQDEWDNTNQIWKRTSGGCVTLTMEATYLHCVNNGQSLFRRGNTIASGIEWAYIGYSGFDFKASTSNQVWFVSTTATTGGYTIYKWNNAASTATLVPGAGGVKIGPSPDGYAYIVTSSGTIQKYNGASWVTMTGTASDIIVGSDGIPIILTQTVSSYGGKTVQRWNPNTSTWTTLDGIGGVALAVDGRNTPYVITSTYNVYRLKGQVSNICPSIITLSFMFIYSLISLFLELCHVLGCSHLSKMQDNTLHKHH